MWAQLARGLAADGPDSKAFTNNAPVVVGTARKHVFLPEGDAPSAAHPEAAERAVDLQNLRRLTVANIPKNFTKGMLVLDTNAFIKGFDDYLNVADAFVTTPQVIQEIRDANARDLLERLPVNLAVLDPSPQAIKDVMDTAAKTGDLGTMSRTDIRLCALALECCAATGALRPRIVPTAPSVNPTAFGNGGEPSGSGEAGAIEVVAEEVSDDEGPEASADAGDGAQASLPGWGGDEDDGGGEWITANNIREIQAGSAAGAQAFDGGCACATSDFAMQNTLLHLGVPIVGPRGMRISELRLWILRCHACFTVVTDTTRQFCPECGSGNTLRRVNYVVQENGEKQLFINFKRRITTRGTIYNLPKPRGGRNGTNRRLVLREDQLGHVIRAHTTGVTSQQAKMKQVLAEEDDLAAFGETRYRKKKTTSSSQPMEFSSYHSYNVNERKKARAGKQK